MPRQPGRPADAGATGGGPAGTGAGPGSGARPEQAGCNAGASAARTDRGSGGDKRRPPPDDPFVVWLHRSLREAFGAVAAEPGPVEILRRVEADRAERVRTRRRRGAAAAGRQPGGGEAG